MLVVQQTRYCLYLSLYTPTRGAVEDVLLQLLELRILRCNVREYHRKLLNELRLTPIVRVGQQLSTVTTPLQAFVPFIAAKYVKYPSLCREVWEFKKSRFSAEKSAKEEKTSLNPYKNSW